MHSRFIRYLRPGALALAAALLVGRPALADDAKAEPAPISDSDLRDAVADAVLGYSYYGVFDSVGVGVEGGVVTLQGSVLQPWRKDDIGRLAAKVEGVRQVKNELRVQPPSPFDDQLRAQLFRRIYGGPLERYSSMTNPPVHIVVENGRITLTGNVTSRVDKALIASIARGTLSFQVDDQVQVESDTPKEAAKAPAKS